MKNKGKKQAKALEVLEPNTQKLPIKGLIPESLSSEEAKNELNKIKEIEKTTGRENLVYRMNVYTYSFKVFWATKTFGRDIYNGTITLKEVDKTQIDLLIEILNFKKRIKPHNLEIFLKT